MPRNVFVGLTSIGALWLFLVLVVVTHSATIVAPRSQTNSELVSFPSAEIEFIIGPQVKSGTSQISGAAWFDQTAIERGMVHGAAFPADPPLHVLRGTVSVVFGSATMTGSGTKFLLD